MTHNNIDKNKRFYSKRKRYIYVYVCVVCIYIFMYINNTNIEELSKKIIVYYNE